MSAGLFSFLVGLFQQGLGRVEKGKEVDSGRKQEIGLGLVENRSEV